MLKKIIFICLVFIFSTACFGAGTQQKSSETSCEQSTSCWQKSVIDMPYTQAGAAATIQLLRQDYESLQFGQATNGLAMRIGSRTFTSGLGTHAVSRIKIYSVEPIKHFSSWIGANYYEKFGVTSGSVVFSVHSDKGELYKSAIKKVGEEPERIEVNVNNSHVLYLNVDDGGDGLSWDHASWAEAAITLAGGEVISVDKLRRGLESLYPFSFIYDGRHSNEILSQWQKQEQTKRLDEDRTQVTISWQEPSGRLKVIWDAICYRDFPALEWIVYFENTGNSDTAIIEDIQALEMFYRKPIDSDTPFRLYKTNGAPSNEADFEASTVVMKKGSLESLWGGGGRSSNKDFPFFKIESGEGSTIIAVGWSGQWQSNIMCNDNDRLQVTAGLQKTHFLLHAGEKVRMPRMLVLQMAGDTVESNALFRQLVYKHYAAKRSGEKVLPTLYSNTCWTRKGFWLNETTEENQISLINAFAGLGVEAIVTDAGWFDGGWPDGAGNWNVRKDNYPNGMGPVAAAAKKKGQIYGLWFEFERVMEGTALAKNHPEWLLKIPDSTGGFYKGAVYLADFGRQEVQDYFFGIVKGFMDLPGFRAYRQDFNMEPLPYWLANDAADRQGILEIRYITGLYSYWERIAKTWPESLLIECASGGRRIDLETVMRMHIHQKSDFSFDNVTNQASIWGLSQYLPNNVVETVIDRLDDYSFHSAIGATLDLGWIADGKEFDTKRAKKLVEKYKSVRHLLIGAWYPLTGYSRDEKDWLGSQYHRADLDEGMVLVFRRGKSQYKTIQVNLRGLSPEGVYEVSMDLQGTKQKVKGSELMNRFAITLDEPTKSEMIVYKRVSK